MFTQGFIIQGLKQQVSFILMLAILFVPLQSIAAVDNTTEHCMMPGCEHQMFDSLQTSSAMETNDSVTNLSEHPSGCQDEHSCETSCSECAQFNLTIISSIKNLPLASIKSSSTHTIPFAISYIAKLETPPPINF